MIMSLCMPIFNIYAFETDINNKNQVNEEADYNEDETNYNPPIYDSDDEDDGVEFDENDEMYSKGGTYYNWEIWLHRVACVLIPAGVLGSIIVINKKIKTVKSNRTIKKEEKFYEE